MADFDLSAYSNLGKSKKLPGIGARSSLTGGLSTLAPISNSKTTLVGAPVLSPPTRHSAPKVVRPMTSTARPQGSISANASFTSPSSGIASNDSHSQTSSLGASPILGRPKLKPINATQGSLGQHGGRGGLKRRQNDLPGNRAAPQRSPGNGGQPQYVINSAEFEKTSTVPWVVNNAGPRRSISPQRSPDSGRGSVASPFLSPANSGTASFLQASPLASNTRVGETLDVMKQLPSLAPQSLTSPVKPKKGNKKRINSGQDSITSLMDNLNSSTPTEAPTPPTTNQIVRQHSGRRITKPLPAPETPPPPDKPNTWSLSLAPPISPVRSCVSVKSQTSISRETSNTSIGIRASESKLSASLQNGNVSPSARSSSTPQKQPKPPVSPDSGVGTPPSPGRWNQPKINTAGSEGSLSPRSPRSPNMASSSSSPFKPAVLAPIGQSQANSLNGRPKLAPIKSADVRGSSLKPIVPSTPPEHETHLMQERVLEPATMNGRGFQPATQNVLYPKQMQERVLEPATLNRKGFQPATQNVLYPNMPQQTAAPNPFGSKPVLAPVKKAPFQCAPLKPINPSTQRTTHEAPGMTREKRMDQTPSPLMSNSSQSDMSLNRALSLSPNSPSPFGTVNVSPFNGKAVLAPINKAPFLQAPLGPIGSSTPAQEETRSLDNTEQVCETTSHENPTTSSSQMDRFRKSMTPQQSGPSQPSQKVSGTTSSRSFSIGRRRQTSDFWDSSSDDMSEQEELQDTRQESAADFTDHSNSLNQGTSSNHGTSSSQSGASSSGRRLNLASKKLIIVKRHNPNGNGSETKAEFATIDRERMKCNNLAVDDLVPPSCYGRKSLRDQQRSCKEIPQSPVRSPSETSDDESSKSFVFESPSTHHSYHTSDEDSDTSYIDDAATEEDEGHHPLPATIDHEAKLEEYRRKFNIGTSAKKFPCQAEAKVPQEDQQSKPIPAEMSKRDMYAAMIATIAREIDEADAAKQKLALQSSRGEPEENIPLTLTDVSVGDNINHRDKVVYTKSTPSGLPQSNKVDEKKEDIATKTKQTDGSTQETDGSTPAMGYQTLPPPDAIMATKSQVTSTETSKSNRYKEQQRSIQTKSKNVQTCIPEKKNDVKNLDPTKSESIPEEIVESISHQVKYADIPESHGIDRASSQAATKSTFTSSRNDDDRHSIQTKSDSIPEEIEESIPEEVNDEEIPEPHYINRASSQAVSKSTFTSSRNDDDRHSIQTKSDSIPEEIEESIPEEVNDEEIPEPHYINRASSQAVSKSTFTSSRNDDDRHSIQTKSDSIPEEIEEFIPEEVNTEEISEPHDINKASSQAATKSIFTSSRNDDDRHSIQTKSDSIPEEIEESVPEKVNAEEISEPHDIDRASSQAATKPIFTSSRNDDDRHSIQTKSDSIPEEIEESVPEEVNDEEIPEPHYINRASSQAASKPLFTSSRNDDDHHSIQTKSDSIPEEIEESIPDEVSDEEVPEPHDIDIASLQAATKTIFSSSKSDDDRHSIQTKSESIPEEIEESIPEEVKYGGITDEEILKPQRVQNKGSYVISQKILHRNDDDHHSIQTKSESIPEESVPDEVIEESIPDEVHNEGISEPQDLSKDSRAASQKVFHSSKNVEDHYSIQTKSESIPEDIEEPFPGDLNNKEIPEPQHIIREGRAQKKMIQRNRNDDDRHSIQTKSESIPEEIEESVAEEISQEELSESGDSIRRSSSATSHGSRHQQDHQRSQNASEETDETVSEEMSEEDATGSDSGPTSFEKSGAIGKVHLSSKKKHQRMDRIQVNAGSTSHASEESNTEEIFEGEISESEDERSEEESNSNQLRDENGEDSEAHDAEIQASEDDNSDSIPEEIDVSNVEEITGEESTSERMLGSISGRSGESIPAIMMDANSQITRSSSPNSNIQSESRSPEKHHQDTRKSKLKPNFNATHLDAQGKNGQDVLKTTLRYKRQTEGERVDQTKDEKGGKYHPGHSNTIIPSNKVIQIEKDSTHDEEESVSALVTDSQLTGVNSSQLTSVFSSDPNKPSEDSEMLEAQRNVKQGLRWSSSTSASLSIGINGSAALTSPSGLSPTEPTLKSQQQSVGPTSQHSSCDNGTDVDKVSCDEQRRITDTLKTKRGKDKTTKDKTRKQHKDEKKASSSSMDITVVSDNSQLGENSPPSITKGDNAPTSKTSKQHQQRERDKTVRRRTGKRISMSEDETTHSKRQDAECPKPSKETFTNTYHKSKKEENHHKAKTPKTTQDKASKENVENVSAQVENIHQKKGHKRDTTKSGNTYKDGEDTKKNSKDSNFDQGDTVKKVGQLSTGILSSWKDELSEEQKVEMKHKAIKCWIINTTQSLGDVYHGDSSTGATIICSGENGTTSSQMEDRHSERSQHGMDEDLEAGGEKTISSFKKLETINRVPNIGSNVDTAAAPQSHMMSRASQTTKISHPHQTDIKTIPCSACQVTKPTILTTHSSAMRQPLNSSVTECNEICCRTRGKLARAIGVDEHIEAAPGTSMRGLPNETAGNEKYKNNALNTEVKIQRFMSLQDVPSMSNPPKIEINYDPHVTPYHKQNSYLSYSPHQRPFLGSSHYSTLPTTDNTISYPIARTTPFIPPFSFEDTIPKRLPHNGEFGLNGDHQHDMRIWRQFCNQVTTDINNSSKPVYYMSPKIHGYDKETKVEEMLTKTETETDDDMDGLLMDELNRKREEMSTLREKYYNEMDEERRRVQDLEDKIQALEKKLTDQKIKSDIDLMKIQRDTEVKVKTLQVQLNKKQNECMMVKVTSKAVAERDAKNMQEIMQKLSEMEEKMKLQEGMISQMNDQQIELTNKNVAQRDEIDSLTKQNSLLETSTVSLHEKLENVKTEESKKEREVMDWKDKYHTMVETVSKFKKGTRKLKKMLQNRDEQLADMTKQNKENTEKVSQLEGRVQAIEKEKNHEEKCRKSLQKDLDDARAERKRLREEATSEERKTAKVISAFQKSLEEARNQKKDLEANLNKMTDSLKEKKKSEIELQGQKALLEVDITSLREKLAEKDRLTLGEKQVLMVAKTTENELRQKVDRYRDWIRESRRTIGNLYDSKELLMRKIASLEFELSCDNTTREAKYDIIQRQLDDANSKISRLETLLETKTEELSGIRFDFKEAQLQIKQKEFSEQTKDTRISLLEQDVTKLKEENSRETKDKLSAEVTLQKERQCHQCCVRRLQNNIWALEQSALENAERCKALEVEKQMIITNQRQQQIIEAPYKDETSTYNDNSSTESEPSTIQEQQDMEENLNNEIKILKDYLAAKIESLYSVEQLAEKQATTIKKLKIKLKQIKQQEQPPATQENKTEDQHTTNEAKLRERLSSFYKKKWHDNKKALLEEFTSERESMQQEIQELKQQINQMQGQQNEHSSNFSGHTSQEIQHLMGQASNQLEHQATDEKEKLDQKIPEHPRAVENDLTAEKQQRKANRRRKDPPCPYCSDTDDSSDDDANNKV